MTWKMEILNIKRGFKLELKKYKEVLRWEDDWGSFGLLGAHCFVLCYTNRVHY